MLKVIEGDLFNTTADIIIHGCNCFHKMFSGVAAIVSREYPGAFEEDCRTPYGDPSKLGTYIGWHGRHSRNPNKLITILNAYTQFHPGNNYDYQAIRNSLNLIVKDFPTNSIAICFIGAGIAGGDPFIIFNIFKEVFINSDATLYIRPGEFTEFLNKT